MGVRDDSGKRRGRCLCLHCGRLLPVAETATADTVEQVGATAWACGRCLEGVEEQRQRQAAYRERQERGY